MYIFYSSFIAVDFNTANKKLILENLIIKILREERLVPFPDARHPGPS